jgi:hypothetical protein
MSIIKSKHASDYTIIPNIVFKSGLSMDAIGLLAYLLSLPHDWVVYKTTLHLQMDCGKTKLDGAFKELQATGFILSVRKQKSNGKIEYEHIVYDKPYNGEPLTEKPYTEKPSTVNQTLLNTNIESTNKQSKEYKINIIEANKQKFIKDLEPYVSMYGRDMVNDFFKYWSELNQSQTKMKFQLEKTWQLSLRLERWSRNNFNKQPQQTNPTPTIKLGKA